MICGLRQGVGILLALKSEVSKQDINSKTMFDNIQNQLRIKMTRRVIALSSGHITRYKSNKI